MSQLEAELRRHAFLNAFSGDQIHSIAKYAWQHHFGAGHYLIREGGAATECFLIRHGKVALELAVPGKKHVVIETLGAGDMLGASWVLPPYHWRFDARTLEQVSVLGIDAVWLRSQCETDHDLGYVMMKACLGVFIKRLQATRLQILDVYRAD